MEPLEPCPLGEIEHYQLKFSGLLGAVEQFYLLNKRLPRSFTTDLRLGGELTEREVLTICCNEKFTKHLVSVLGVSRGELKEAYCQLFKLSWTVLEAYMEHGGKLSPSEFLVDRWLTNRQLAAVNMLLDSKDGRSHAKKLSELSISTAEWQAWMRNPDFQAYITRRAEHQLVDSEWEAHSALLDNVTSGNLGAIQYYYKLIGKDPEQDAITTDQAKLMVQTAVGRIMEVLSKYVDNDTMELVAQDLGLVNVKAPPREILMEAG